MKEKIGNVLALVGGVVLVALVIWGGYQTEKIDAAAPKITVGKYVYMTLDPKGIYTNAQGLKYSYVTGYLGWFLRDGIIYFQGVDCTKIPAGVTPFYNQQTGCYYEYGVDVDYPRFLYGNATLPTAQ